MNVRNNISFYGWEAGSGLSGKLNNEKELNELANVSKVDNIRTNISQDNKYLPSDDTYLTMSSKNVDGKLFYGIDCVILSKDTPKEKVSETIFNSAQNSIGKLYGNIAKFNIKNKK